MEKNDFRNYEKDTPQYFLYKEQHEKQTIDFVKQKKEEYSKLNQGKMTIQKALSLLNDFVDPSDPDLDIENSIPLVNQVGR